MNALILFGILLSILLAGPIKGEVHICFDFNSQDVSETEGNIEEVKALQEQADKEIANILSTARLALAAETDNYTNFFLNISHPAITVTGNFTNGTTCTANSTIRLWTIKEEGLEIFNLTFPSIFMNGSYDVNGYVGAHRLFDIYGTGTFHFNLTDFSLAAVTGLFLNNTALCISVTVNVNLNDFKGTFENFMDGDDDLDPLLNGAIQNIVPEAVRIMSRDTFDLADPRIQEIIDKILHGSKINALPNFLSILAKNKDKLTSILHTE